MTWLAETDGVPRWVRGVCCGLLAPSSLTWLGNAETAAPAAQPAEQVVYARSRTTWIYPAPRRSPRPLGYLRAGHSLALRDGDIRRGAGCQQGWVATRPRGFVCLDRAALGPAPRFVRALHETLLDAEPLDFDFALSGGTPAFQRVPTAAEADQQDRRLGAPFRWAPPNSQSGHEQLANADTPTFADAVPWFLLGGGAASRPSEPRLVRRLIPGGFTLAYTKRFLANGRGWLLTTDGTIVPADRVRFYRRTTFHGQRLGGGLVPPLFWPRGQDSPRYVMRGDGAPEVEGHFLQASMVGLDPSRSSISHARRRYLKTRERTRDGAPVYVLDTDATVVANDVSPPVDVGPTGKWIQFSISKGTLIAYQGTRPVFATLASPGAGGIPTAGNDPVRFSTTPLGTFRISVKHLNDDMGDAGPASKFRMAEVPYAQYFDMPFAIHVAYWHESFGQPMSGGCINVAPLDGKFLFDWTSPELPPGWDAVVAGGEHGLGTLVRVVR